MIYTDKTIKKKKNRNIKIIKALKYIALLLLGIIFILVCYVAYMKYIMKESNINLFGLKHYIVMTGSMEPIYNRGDVVVIKQIPKEELKIDDVITYSVGNINNTVTHRITDIVEQDGNIMYKTKGDNNNSEDPDLVSLSQIQGVVLFKISKLGLLLTKLLTRTGIVLVFALVLLSYLRASRKEEKRIAREDIRKVYNIPKYEKEDSI